MAFFEKSVASITAKLQRTVDELEAHAMDQITRAERKTAHIAELTFEKIEHSKEFELAKKIADNIKSMLS
ncbi:MAG: hypothetical protein ACHQWH_02505 [Nitrososphaerales archaeon]|jgi:hypothetical protein